jgi:hypothetical protein
VLTISLVTLRSKPTSYTLAVSFPKSASSDLHTGIIKELAQHKKPKSFADFLVYPAVTIVNNRISYHHTNLYSPSHVNHVTNSSAQLQVTSPSSVDGQEHPGHHGTNHANTNLQLVYHYSVNSHLLVVQIQLVPHPAATYIGFSSSGRIIS